MYQMLASSESTDKKVGGRIARPKNGQGGFSGERETGIAQDVKAQLR